MYYVNVNENELPFSKRRTLAWGSRQSRPIEIKISRSVQINFWKVSRLSLLLRQDYFFSQSRFLKSRFFGQDLYSSRYLSRSPRQIKTVEIYWDFQDLLRIFEISWHYRESFSRLFRDFRLKNLNKLRNLDREMW